MCATDSTSVSAASPAEFVYLWGDIRSTLSDPGVASARLEGAEQLRKAIARVEYLLRTTWTGMGPPPLVSDGWLLDRLRAHAAELNACIARAEQAQKNVAES